MNKEVFLKSTTTEIVRELYEEYTKQHRSPSLENFARSLEIPTKGQLSKILSGKQIISENHIEKISNYFQLSDEERSLLTLMSKVERKKKKVIEINLKDEIKKIKKIISINSIDNFSNPSILVFLIINIVYTKGEIDRIDIANYLQEFSLQRIDLVLDQLIRKNILEQGKEGEFIIGENINFYLDFKKLSNSDLKEFINEAVTYIGINWSKQYDSSETSFFETSAVTVRKDKYMQWLGELRKKLDNELADVQEDDFPEEVISFNLQIFPVQPSFMSKVRKEE